MPQRVGEVRILPEDRGPAEDHCNARPDGDMSAQGWKIQLVCSRPAWRGSLTAARPSTALAQGPFVCRRSPPVEPALRCNDNHYWSFSLTRTMVTCTV